MRDITKAQLTVGLLAFFATMWELVLNVGVGDVLMLAGIVLVQLVVLMLLAYILIALLEWVRVFDLRTNAVLTLVVLVTFRILSSVSIG
jgi:low affinity Fe/Cu permease